MNSEPLNNALLFLGMLVISFLLEMLITKIHFLIVREHYKEHHLTLGKYIFLLFFPFVSLFIILNRVGLSLLKDFVIFAVLGTFLEWFVGLSYHKIVGQRLWTYHRYAIFGYTSFLTIPLWGLAGVLYSLLALAFL